MFPPSSPVAERIRAQSEFAELERQAQFKAASQPMRRWSFAKLFLKFKRQHADTPEPKRDFASARAEFPLKNT